MDANFLKSLIEQEKKLIEALKGIQALKSIYSVDTTIKTPVLTNESKINIHLGGKVEYPDYDKNWLTEQKVIFALKQLGSGVTDDVANKLIEIDSNYDFNRAKSAVTNKLSTLYRDGKIDADRIGKKYRYKIKEEDIKKEVLDLF